MDEEGSVGLCKVKSSKEMMVELRVPRSKKKRDVAQEREGKGGGRGKE
jgi:hypothetical protein